MIYDLFGATNLTGFASTNSDWLWFGSGTNGQTLLLTNPPSDHAFFVLSCRTNVQVNDPAQDYGTDQNTQNETSVVAFGDTVIVAWIDSNQGVPGDGNVDFGCDLENPWYPPKVPESIGWAVSSDGGLTFSDRGGLPLFSNKWILQPTNSLGEGYLILTNLGTARDPHLARDNVSGTIYLTANPQRPSVYYPNTNQPGQLWVPMWRSTDNGQTLTEPLTVCPGFTNQNWNDYGDGPYVMVDNSPGTGQGDVYVSFLWIHNAHDFVLCRSTNGGATWQIIQQIPNVLGGRAFMSTNHEALVTWQSPYGDLTTLFIARSSNRGETLYTTNVTHPPSPGRPGVLTRSNSSPADDRFDAGVPSYAVNPVNGDFYYAYYATNAGMQRADIYFSQLTNSGDWSDPIQVNVEPGGIETDQWQPAMAVKPDGTQLFIAWYDRRDDPTNHSLVRVYGAFARLPIVGTNSFAPNFPISTVAFPPVFTGTTMTGTNQFDPVYPPLARDDGRQCPTFGGVYSGFTGDYDRPFGGENHVFFTWSDNRNTYTNLVSGVTRHRSDVRMVTVPWTH